MYKQDMPSIIDCFNQSNYLWMDHFNYTRQAVISTIAKISDVPAIVDRLITNKDDIISFLKMYYPDNVVVDMIDKELRQHVILVVSLLSALSNNKDTTTIVDELKTNGEQIANWLSALNSKMWTKSTILDLWNRHIDSVIAQANARLSTDWIGDIAASDDNHDCISQLAYLFAKGIIYQNLPEFTKKKTAPKPKASGLKMSSGVQQPKSKIYPYDDYHRDYDHDYDHHHDYDYDYHRYHHYDYDPGYGYDYDHPFFPWYPLYPWYPHNYYLSQPKPENKK